MLPGTIKALLLRNPFFIRTKSGNILELNPAGEAILQLAQTNSGPVIAKIIGDAKRGGGLVPTPVQAALLVASNQTASTLLKQRDLIAGIPEAAVTAWGLSRLLHERIIVHQGEPSFLPADDREALFQHWHSLIESKRVGDLNKAAGDALNRLLSGTITFDQIIDHFPQDALFALHVLDVLVVYIGTELWHFQPLGPVGTPSAA